jgi:uncharacterized protein YcfJ
MKRYLVLAAGVLLASFSVAMADSGGTAAGAVTGGVAGAAVGGPVGAAVGAAAGAAVGDSASGPDRKDIIEDHDVPTGSVGCSTTTTQKTNEFGDTKTKQRTDC